MHRQHVMQQPSVNQNDLMFQSHRNAFETTYRGLKIVQIFQLLGCYSSFRWNHVLSGACSFFIKDTCNKSFLALTDLWFFAVSLKKNWVKLLITLLRRCHLSSPDSEVQINGNNVSSFSSNNHCRSSLLLHHPQSVVSIFIR